jgi:hypothetical protein
MTATLISMSPAIVVLLVAGTGVIGLAWWLSVKAEGKDEWITGEEIHHD